MLAGPHGSVERHRDCRTVPAVARERCLKTKSLGYDAGVNAIDAYKIARATVRVLRDSNQTLEIFRVEELTGRGRFHDLIQRLAGDSRMERLLAERPELGPERVDFAALRTLPENTLGRAYMHHLDDNGLSVSPELTATRFTDDPDIAYLVRRSRQSHDVTHALLGLGTSGHEEVLVHSFSFGQLGLPVSALIMFFGGIKHMILEKRWNALRRGILRHYRHGRRAAPLLPVFWEELWSESLDDVRRRFDVEICPPVEIHH